MSDDIPLETLVERLNRLFSDDLEGDEQNPDGYEIRLDIWNGGESMRLRVGPKITENNHSWESDLGHIHQTEETLREFVYGLEKARDIDRLASPA